MERRQYEHHLGRLSEAMREEITAIIEGELQDPRVGLVAVTEVQLAPDGRSAHVLVVVSGDESDAKRTLQGLDAATGYIRRELGYRLRLRQAPELFFRLDRSEQYESRIDELLRRIHRRS